MTIDHTEDGNYSAWREHMAEERDLALIEATAIEQDSEKQALELEIEEAQG